MPKPNDNNSVGPVMQSELNFIDLAGSEKYSVHNQKQQ